MTGTFPLFKGNQKAMSRTQRQKNTEYPVPKPVEQVSLSAKHLTLRILLLVLAIGVAATAFTLAFRELIHGNDGWQTVTASSATLPACAGDLTLRYYFGSTGESSRSEMRNVTKIYTEACETVWRLYDAGQQYDGVYNLAYLNAHPNEEVPVEEVLYETFALLNRCDSSYAFLAPLIPEYTNLFSSGDDTVAAEYDPMRNKEVAELFGKICKYVQSGDISLRLNEETHTARLEISEEYLAFARENGISAFVDLWWMQGAFSVDYIAKTLTEKGYPNGYLSSAEGFSSTLGQTGTLTASVFDHADGNRYEVAQVSFEGPVHSVYLHAQPDSETDRSYRYAYADGSVTTAYLSPADGCSRAALPDLLSYSRTAGCAEILLRLLPIYTAAEADETAFSGLSEDAAIESVWCRSRTIRYTDDTCTFSELYQNGTVSYRTEKAS